MNLARRTIPFALRAALRRSHNQPTPQLSTAFNALTRHTLPGFAASIHTSSPRPISGAMSPSAVSNTSNGTAGAPKQNAWAGHLGAAGFDLRSDTMTTPTASMLAAIQNCSLLDDVFVEDPTTMELESHVAALAGKEAALLVLSGTMGNQVALRALLTQPPYSVLSDHRSHIIKYEAGGVASLCGAMIQPVVPRNGAYLTLEDIEAHAALDDDVHTCPTRVISLENTLGGVVTPLAEVKRIAEFARKNNLKLHCDGARMWEAVASGAGSLSEYCSLFDTVSLCFSKGLGAPIGSIVVGDAAQIKHARWVRKSIGGGLRQSGVVAAPARIAVDETFGKGPNGEGGLLKSSHETAKRIGELWTSLGGKLTLPVDTNMCWLDLDAAGCSTQDFIAFGAELGLKLIGNRLVIHYQIAQNQDRVLPKLEQVFRRALEGGSQTTGGEKGPTNMYQPR
ncbi:beta-eliminating lyase [Colletotrichum costaricense]|uniref:Beta-eliminating lyase n=2 Tax=Colletotrichum acutatum species complex TaxID=2707335 RepID=A0AAI9YYL3_9PEZI|nr:beta-eliminating lyase [Colletotrichum costaricense]XP_060384662.1 beta-eliminating lyase [Colletotrichum tamarilloi]KAK1503366.1 beta-eliminating lyase [Colletotrichum tamarilloi]KAK1527515.1 beta-eliminating lyase [Colletotrichum costaricense]